jgi:hypothetical protein
MREGCGQEVELGRLLYVCDRLPGNGTHMVHLTFEAKRIAGTVGDVAKAVDSRPIRGVECAGCAGQATFQLRSPSRATTSMLPPSAAT